MIQRFIHSLLLRRHFWRYASFSEIAELYASRVLHMAAYNMAGVFISVFLYQSGFSIAFIGFYWVAFYLVKVLISLPSAAFVARFGPKHGVLVSNIIYIPAMVGFALVPSFGEWILYVILVLNAIAASLYSISHGVDFSKVKSADHAGKEIAYMNVIDKVTNGLTPLIGGFLAFVFGPELVIVIAAILFLVAALPLLRTAEPMKRGLKLKLRGFPWHLLRGHAIAQTSYGFDVFTSGTVWSLFVTIVIVGVAVGDQIYVINGVLLSVVLFASLIASYAYGRLIDGRRGKDLFQLSVVINAAIHLIRPATGNTVLVAGLNAANEAATTGYVMPYTRGIFDNADLSGHRITYVGLTEILSNFGAMVGALTLAVLALTVGEVEALGNFFYIGAAVVLLLLTARFPLYRRLS